MELGLRSPGLGKHGPRAGVRRGAGGQPGPPWRHPAGRQQILDRQPHRPAALHRRQELLPLRDRAPGHPEERRRRHRPGLHPLFLLYTGFRGHPGHPAHPGHPQRLRQAVDPFPAAADLFHPQPDPVGFPDLLADRRLRPERFPVPGAGHGQFHLLPRRPAAVLPAISAAHPGLQKIQLQFPLPADLPAAAGLPGHQCLFHPAEPVQSRPGDPDHRHQPFPLPDPEILRRLRRPGLDQRHRLVAGPDHEKKAKTLYLSPGRDLAELRFAAAAEFLPASPRSPKPASSST